MAFVELFGFMLFFMYFFNFCPEIRISLFRIVLIILSLLKLTFMYIGYINVELFGQSVLN